MRSPPRYLLVRLMPVPYNRPGLPYLSKMATITYVGDLWTFPVAICGASWNDADWKGTLLANLAELMDKLGKE
jgi:hypothetical protein